MDPNYIYFFRGLAYSLQGDSDLAITDFDEIIGRNPKLDQSIAFSTNLVRVYINRAIALIEEDDLQAAIADLDKALILDPEADLAYMYRGIAHEKQGEMDIAIEDYGKAIKYSDGDKCAYIQRGNGFKLQGELDAALADYNKAVETDPNFALGYVNIGVVYRDEGDSDAAETAFKKALEADSESADAYNMLGFMNKERGDIENALSYYSKVIEIDPTYSGVYSTRAGLFEKLNEPQRAIDDYIRSMDYSTTNNYAASKIVNLCKDSNLCNYTEKVLDSTLTQSPHNGWFYYVRGKLFVQTGDYAKAENSFIAALELDSSQTSWLEALANVYEETGKTDQVLDTYIKLVQLEASNNYHRQKLAQFCKSNDLCRPTAIELTQLILGQPDTLPLLLARAQVYQTYDVKKALKDFDKAISLKPNESDVYELRAKAHEDGGNFDDALNDYFAAIKLDEKDFHTSYSIINVCQKINNCDEVIFHLNETIVRQGGVPSLIYTRARVHEARENYTAALDDYSYLLRLGSDIGLSNIYTHRAEVFENLGHIQLAIDDRTRLIEDYNSSESLYRRGLLYEKQGKIDLALTDFQDYLKKNPSSHRKKEIDDMIQELTQ
jgi:tetratricopeptide (TPR) repeat protein